MERRVAAEARPPRLPANVSPGYGMDANPNREEENIRTYINKHQLNDYCTKALRALVVTSFVIVAGACAPAEDAPGLNVTFDEIDAELTAQCKTGSMGSDTSCKSESAWEAYADQVCTDHGTRLSAFKVGDPCKSKSPANVSSKSKDIASSDVLEPLAKKGYRIAKFTCCAKPQIDIKPTPTKPQPSVDPVLPQQKCYTDMVGSKDMCHDPAKLKYWASKTCASTGGHLSAIKGGQECKGGYNFAKFECCKDAQVAMPKPTPTKPTPTKPGVTPIQPEQKCYSAFLGDDEKVCLQADEFKMWAYKVCANDGGNLNALSLGQSCGKSGHSLAKFECCIDAVEPTPTKPTPEKPEVEETQDKCFSTLVGSKDICLAPADLKAMANKTCAKANAHLENASLGYECKGGFHAVKVTCCVSAADIQEKPDVDMQEKPDTKPVDTKPTDTKPVDDSVDEISDAQCATGSYGGGKMCIANHVLKAIAHKMCASKGLELEDAALGTSCGKGASNGVKFECCE